MTLQVFIDRVTAAYSLYFPHSEIVIALRSGLGNYLHIICYLSLNANECAHGIRRNDPLQLTFCIDANGNDLPTLNPADTLPELLTLKPWEKHYRVKPVTEHMYCCTKSAPVRKVNGTPEKIAATLQTHFMRTRDAIKGELDAGNILPEDEKFIREKLGM